MNQESIQITLLHTNDMHGRLGSMSRLSTFARRLRKELEAQGRQVFFFDAGDAADRSVRFCGVTKGEAFPRILEAMGYHLQTLGNAISITYGPQAASRMALKAGYPTLGANFITADGSLLEGIQATAAFLLAKSVRLGVLGLTAHMPDYYAFFNLKLPDYRDVARQWLPALNQQGVGPLVVVSHLGNREEHLLAQVSPEIDVILGGHSHTELPQGELVNGVLIAQTGSYAKYLGRVDLAVDPRSGKVLTKTAALLEVPVDTPLDPAVEDAVREAQQEAEALLNQPVGELNEALSLEHFAECGIGNLAADVIRDRMRAEAAMLTSGLFHKGLPAGKVTLGDLDAACFTTANPELSEVRGEQIVAALEKGLEPAYMESVLKMFRGTPVGIPVISGMTVEYDPAAESGQRVKKVTVQGQPLELKRVYRVAHTDAEVKEEHMPAGYFTLEAGQTIKIEVPTILREAIEDYLKANSPAPAPALGRWIKVQ